MKKISFIFILSFASIHVQAEGYYCQALCIVLDSAQHTLYFLDDVQIEAGTKKSKTHRLLKKVCQKKAQALGLYYGSTIVDTLEYESSSRVSRRKMYPLNTKAEVLDTLRPLLVDIAVIQTFD